MVAKKQDEVRLKIDKVKVLFYCKQKDNHFVFFPFYYLLFYSLKVTFFEFLGNEISLPTKTLSVRKEVIIFVHFLVVHYSKYL